MTVYVATDGSYSDYHIEAVFTDKSQAELFCAVNECCLEEYEADEIKTETQKKPKRIWYFTEDRGHFYNIWTENEMTFDDKKDFSMYCKKIAINASIDEETAKKIIYDEYLKFKAEQENI